MGTPGQGAWNDPDTGLLGSLAQFGTAATLYPVRNAAAESRARQRYVGVRAALRMLLANGMIKAVPQEDWPARVILDPPAE